LVGCTSQQPDRFISLRAFKPSSSDSADRGRSIIQVTITVVIRNLFWSQNKEVFTRPGKSRNIIRHQQKVYTSKTLLQLVKSEIIMLIESTPRKPIDTRIFVNELNEVVEFIK
jgi:hypothetical protein